MNSFPKLCFMHCVRGAENASTSDSPSVPAPLRVSVLHEQSYMTNTFHDRVTDPAWMSAMQDTHTKTRAQLSSCIAWEFVYICSREKKYVL